jgi:hypothetical protein
MAQLSIKVDLSSVVGQARGIIDASIFPRLNQAVSAVAQQATIDWKEAVARAKLWTGEKVPYGESITWKMTGAFSAEVSSDYKYAQEIDEGRPARDLKRMLDTSLKVRTAKSGKRYLIIPFRHQVPGADAIGQSMPADVYELAKNLAPSRVVGRGRRLSGTGAMDIKTRKPITVASRKYAWGGQLDFRDEAQFMAAPNAQKKHQGMYRFDTSSGKAKSSQYLTFRVMVEGAPGWVIPPRAGLHLVQGVTTRLQPLAEKAFSEAVKRDLS